MEVRPVIFPKTGRKKEGRKEDKYGYSQALCTGGGPLEPHRLQTEYLLGQLDTSKSSLEPQRAGHLPQCGKGKPDGLEQAAMWWDSGFHMEE